MPANPESKRPIVRWTVLGIAVLLAAVVSLSTYALLSSSARRASARWDEVVDGCETALPALAARYSRSRKSDWTSLDQQIDALTASLARPSTRTPTTLERWRSVFGWTRTTSWGLDLGPSYADNRVTLRQERRWFATDLAAYVESLRPLDGVRLEALRRTLEKLDVPLAVGPPP